MTKKEVRKLVYTILACSYDELANELERQGAPGNIVKAVRGRVKGHVKDSEWKTVLEQDQVSQT